MEKYIAFDNVNFEFEHFNTLEDAQEWLSGAILNDDEYADKRDISLCGIYELKQTIKMNLIDSRDNYKYDYEDDAPEGEEELAWPYSSDYDEIYEHEFIDVKPE